MTAVDYVRSKRVTLKTHPEYDERWPQRHISEDPSLLGLGIDELDVKDAERRQPDAGRLDLLLYDASTSTRYEVEIQLGPTDESHIIRTLEYWDNERRRFPQYDHVAVIVAEEITKVEAKYNKHYIGLQRGGLADNFITFRPRKKLVTIEFRLERSETLDAAIEDWGLSTLPYDNRWKRYRVQLAPSDLAQNRDKLAVLARLSRGEPMDQALAAPVDANQATTSLVTAP